MFSPFDLAILTIQLFSYLSTFYMRKISEILQDARLEKGYSLEEVVRSIKIKKQFLIAIENADYFALPSESYALGFIKNYAQFLGIDRNRRGRVDPIKKIKE